MENTAGDGTAWTGHSIDAAVDTARSVHSADVDGDGDLDVLGAGRGKDVISWWENTAGDGSAWSEHAVDTAFDGAVSVSAADVDGDGDIDVLGAASFADDIAWWENTAGNGTAWTKHTVDAAFDGANDVSAGDVDGDGDLDILGAAWVTDEVAWWENTAGNGTAWTKHTVDAAFDGAYSAHAADMDGDGDIDVLGAAWIGGDIAWWENTAGNGTTWTKTSIDVSFGGAQSVFAADLDGDGDLDALGAASTADDIAWWENTSGDGSTWTDRTVEGTFESATSVHASDLDGDGDVDILGAAFSLNKIAWWENTTLHRSALTTVENTVDGSFDGAISISAGDIDGDGDIDVVGAGDAADEISWWESSTGTGSTWTERTVDGSFDGARAVHTADVDNDGDLDIIGAAGSANEVAWWENTATDGTTWTKRTVVTAFGSPQSVDTGDVDGDGDLDILGAAYGDDEVAWFENTSGDGMTWTLRTIDDSFDGARSVHAADIDRDGDLDVVGAAELAYDVVWWENTNGVGTAWTEHVIDASIDGPWAVVVADIDADGDPDVLVASWYLDDVLWFANTAGDGTAWKEAVIDGDFDGASSIFAIDMDGDGDTDVVASAFWTDDLYWWENTTGRGSAWREHIVDDYFNGAYSVQAADVDGDGDVDILGAAKEADAIAWWENRGGQFALPTTDSAPATIAHDGLDDLLTIEALHRGRFGDGDLELTSLELLFEEVPDDPLTTAEANRLVQDLRVYEDVNDDGLFDGTDAMVTSVTSLSLDPAGVQTISFVDGSADIQVAFGSPRRYFVAVELAADTYPNRLRVTHLTESSSAAEDRGHDIPLTLEFAENVSSSQVLATGGCPDQLTIAQATVNGGDYRAAIQVTAGDEATFDGSQSPVKLIAGSTVLIASDVTISGEFTAELAPCPLMH